MQAKSSRAVNAATKGRTKRTATLEKINGESDTATFRAPEISPMNLFSSNKASFTENEFEETFPLATSTKQKANAQTPSRPVRPSNLSSFSTTKTPKGKAPGHLKDNNGIGHGSKNNSSFLAGLLPRPPALKKGSVPSSDKTTPINNGKSFDIGEELQMDLNESMKATINRTRNNTNAKNKKSTLDKNKKGTMRLKVSTLFRSTRPTKATRDPPGSSSFASVSGRPSVSSRPRDQSTSKASNASFFKVDGPSDYEIVNGDTAKQSEFLTTFYHPLYEQPSADDLAYDLNRYNSPNSRPELTKSNSYRLVAHPPAVEDDTGKGHFASRPTTKFSFTKFNNEGDDIIKQDTIDYDDDGIGGDGLEIPLGTDNNSHHENENDPQKLSYVPMAVNKNQSFQEMIPAGDIEGAINDSPIHRTNTMGTNKTNKSSKSRGKRHRNPLKSERKLVASSVLNNNSTEEGDIQSDTANAIQAECEDPDALLLSSLAPIPPPRMMKTSKTLRSPRVGRNKGKTRRQGSKEKKKTEASYISGETEEETFLSVHELVKSKSQHSALAKVRSKRKEEDVDDSEDDCPDFI